MLGGKRLIIEDYYIDYLEVLIDQNLNTGTITWKK